MIVRSFGTLKAISAERPVFRGSSAGSLGMYGGHARTYGQLYRTQPNVRVCVDFLARNFAQLGLHAYRRVSDTDRQRLAGHDLIRWLTNPNPATTRYRLFESLMQDLGVYFNAYWLKVRTDEALGLIRLPAAEMTVVGGLIPTEFIWTVNGQERPFAPSEIVHFPGYDPDDPLSGLSPLETLRQVIAEQAAASDYREMFWTNGARFESHIEIDKDAPAARWSKEQGQAFRAQLQAFTSTGARAGQIPVLPGGLSLKSSGMTAKDAQYVDAYKLSREICAAAYHIPQPLVGILDHATFSNVKEQHKHLYQDCLGPWLVNIAEELERQLLPEAQDTRDVYLEFNIAAKLAGSFEEQANSLSTLTGRPLMTGNEGRARLNLPRITDDPTMDQVAAQQGGPAATASDDEDTDADTTPAAADPDEEDEA